MTTNQNSRHGLVVLGISAILSLGLFFWLRPAPAKHFSSRVFFSFSGWGYDILVNDKLFIRQESIPVSNGRKGFDKKEEAEKIASLIINKLKKGQSPTLTTFELREQGLLNISANAQQGKY